MKKLLNYWTDKKIMQLSTVPKIVKKLELKGYAPEFDDAYLEVWVNPPVKLLERLNANIENIQNFEIPERALTDEEKAQLDANLGVIIQDQMQIYSELLSQGGQKTRMDTVELRTMVESTQDTDPMFWAWVKRKVVEMLNDHRQLKERQ